jgi:hypothetical protein
MRLTSVAELVRAFDRLGERTASRTGDCRT